MKFYYPAVIKEKEGEYCVTFPDFSEIEVQHEKLEQACSIAKESLGKILESQYNNQTHLPQRSTLESIQCGSNAYVMMMEFDINRKQEVNKNVTISTWLANLAEENNIDISNVLEVALTKAIFKRV